MNRDVILDSIDSLYIHEIIYVSSMIIKDCDIIFNSFEKTTERAYIRVDPESQYLINSIIVNASNLKKIFKPKSNKDKCESRDLFNKRKDRGKKLFNLFGFENYDVLNKSNVRNNIEHFDERIDSTFVNFLNESENLLKYENVIYNLTLSTRLIFQSDPYYLRSYIIDEKVAYVDNESINLGVLYSEVETILEKAHSILPPSQSGGGLMIVF
ncbi:hypothetical protein [Aerococcus urinaeequi]|uniref:hypothetical protein n=1 Tax=Aerococcus urinaeequi TaxID=51665 RepID=UPI00366D9BC3